MIANFLKMYWVDIVFVILFIVFMLILIRKGKADVVRKIIYSLVVQAEKELGSKTGEAKYAHVVSQIYMRLPFILRLVFTQQDINRFIEESVKLLKDKLDSHEFDLLSYDQEQKQHI